MRFVAARSTAGTLLAILMSACAGGASDRTEAPEWSLSAEPTLIIGEDGTREGELDRVVAVLPLPGEELAVVDAGHAEIRVFDGTGRYLRTIARRGSGPGEFSQINWAALQGDTLILFDIGQRRLTLLGPSGTLIGTVTPRPEGEASFVFPRARLSTGAWLVFASLSGQRTTEPVGVFRDTTGFGILAASGEGAVHFFDRQPSQPLIAVAGANAIVPSRFGMGVHGVRLGNRIAVVDSDAGSMRLFSETGSGEPRFVLPIPRRPLPSAEVDRLRQEALAAASNEDRRALVDARFATDAVPAQLPVFSSIFADDQNALWLEVWEAAPPPAVQYHIVADDGQLLGRAIMPLGFRPVSAGRDWILGIHRDPDGVQRVMRYGLVRH